jgi:prepilin-type N-terminal cleavage/methylation domain-containing protein
MFARRGNRYRTAVTLIELLCVLTIIAVLATLLLGPASRALRNARNMQWADQSGARASAVVQQLRAFLGERQDFPLLSLEALESLHVFSSAEVRFLHDSRVAFTPVAGSDPDEKIFLSVRLDPGFLTSAGAMTHTRGELRPPH